ncbi:11-beta-hydroxysteroid dehydrogenase-like 5 [Apostasia shenzhenica]|uniref:11-beta-hydroxysteroid dehydrogenase-like 5 n=1 Tax=Apostasia shenzhenica TaxID=1088818 RepID=A0A2I0AGG3_9ASPA|nr:11-beta-hydroxysteroid dehydrogenase-like 5 [Apostasia shenzhenica]
MDLLNSLLNFVVPPASMVMMAFAWPTLTMLHAVEWVFRSLTREDMENKVVVITGASSAIGEQIAYEYAKRNANLVLVAKREQRLWGIRENARLLGAKQVIVVSADVVKEEECQRFIGDTDINFWGCVYPTYVALPHLRQSHGRIVVNASVGNWVPMPRMSLYAAAKAAVISFYETLRLEVMEDVGITIATHGWIGSELSGARFMLEEGAEMQWKEEKEVPLQGARVEEFAKMIVEGACRGEAYVKHPSWYDVFFLYRMLAPDVLQWTFRLLFVSKSGRRKTVAGAAGTWQPLLEAQPARKALPAAPASSPTRSPAGSVKGD